MATKLKTIGPAPKVTAVHEDYIGDHFSASEGPRGSLTVIRWRDGATMHLPGGAATTAITNGLMELATREAVDAFLVRLDGDFEAPETCGRLPLRAA